MAMTRRQFKQENPPDAADMAMLPHRSSVAVEPVTSWWTNNNKFGNRFQGELPGVGEQIPIISCDAFPGPPRAIAVSLFRTDRNVQNQASANAEVYGSITYGAGGVANTFLLDWASGTTFTIIGNSLRASAIMYNPSPDLPYTPYENMVLGVTAGLGSAGACRCPTLTIPTGPIVNGGGLVDIAVPEFAKGVSFIYSAAVAAAAGVDLLVQTNLGATLWSGDSASALVFQRGSGLILPGGSNNVRVINNSALATIRVQVVFQLGL